MDIERAREILANQDSDNAEALEAVAAMLRFDAISNPKLLGLAADLEALAAELQQPDTASGEHAK